MIDGCRQEADEFLVVLKSFYRVFGLHVACQITIFKSCGISIARCQCLLMFNQPPAWICVACSWTVMFQRLG